MKKTILFKIYRFYKDGFSSMTVGKTLWVIILIKLFVIFAVLKLFFFHDATKAYITDKDKSNFIYNQLITDNSKKINSK